MEYSFNMSISFDSKDFKVARQRSWGNVSVDNRKVSGVRYFVWFLLEKGRPDRLKFYWQIQNYIAKSNRVAGTEEIFSRAPCIMDGLKRLARNCSPATDAVCRCSLEISGHCLVAVGVIALLLVGPAKKRKEKKRRKISFFLHPSSSPSTLAHSNIKHCERWHQPGAFNPLHYSLLLMSHEASLRYTFFMIIHEAVMKDKYSLSSTSEENEGKKTQSVSGIDLSSVCSAEIPTSLQITGPFAYS